MSGNLVGTRVDRLVEEMRSVAAMCEGHGAEVWAVNFLRAFTDVKTDPAEAAEAMTDVLAALDIVNAEKRRP